VALLIGYLMTLYHSDMRHRLLVLYDRSIRDGLTGLLNRRGASDAINKSLARHAGSNALLLVDIDNLKMINDLRGHISGDAVITRTAQAIRESIREGDERARLGGDEFIVFSPDCDTEGAAKIAEGIRARLSNQRMPLAGGKFSVSIIISVQDGTSADFTRMYQDADAALYHAREDGKSGFGL
jgi:diguanylate cyclase (GGDEF)-like protein